MSYEEVGRAVGALVDEKNKAYGSAFSKAGDFLKLLYPNGITPEQYGDSLLLVRIFDKMVRIATDKDAFGESPYGDIAGYGILGKDKDDQRKRYETLPQALKALENMKIHNQDQNQNHPRTLPENWKTHNEDEDQNETTTLPKAPVEQQLPSENYYNEVK